MTNQPPEPDAAPETAQTSEDAPYRAMFDTVADAILIADADGRYLDANPAVTVLLGYTRAELLGMTLLDVVADPKWAAAEFGQFLDDGSWRGELELRRKDGVLVPVEARATVVPGMVGRYVSVLRDLRERRAAEEALRRGEARFRALIEQSTDAVVLLDARGNITYASPSTRRVLGYQPAEILGVGAFNRVHPDDQPLVSQTFAAVLAEAGRVATVQFRIRHKDGSWRWTEASGTNLFADPAVGALVTNFHDVTEQRAAQEALADSRNRLDAVLQGVADGVTVQDRTGALVFANEAAARMIGYASVEALLAASLAEIGQRFAFQHADGTAFDRGQLPGARVLRGEAPGEALVRFRLHASGEERWSVVKATAIHGATGAIEFAVNVFADVTDFQRAQQRLALLAEASALLSLSLEYPETLERVARLAVPSFADGCVVDVLDEAGVLRRMAVVHADLAFTAAVWEVERRHPTKAERPVGTASVTRTGRTELHAEVDEAFLRAVARDPEHLTLLRTAPLRSLLVVPLVSRGQVLGAISFTYLGSGRRYSEEDVPLAEELGRRCALALDNARLFREAQAAAADARRKAERLTALARASRAFAEAALDLPAALDAVVHGIGAVHGDGCILRLLSDDPDRLGAVAVWHPDPAAAALARRITATQSPGATAWPPREAMATGRALRLQSDHDGPLRAKVAPAFLPYLERFRVQCLLVLPLVVRGRSIGAITLSREGEAPPYDAEDEVFYQDVADRAALAIDNTLRYQAERHARAEAEAANRAKDEFLSTLSHELRTPLTAMLGWTQLLRQRRLPPSAMPAALETIERGARAQVQLVEDILDVSRIVSGKLRLELRPLDPTAAVQAALETVRPSAEAKGVRLLTLLDVGAGVVLGDADRLQQVVWNLLSNAVKFTSAGGSVTVALAAADRELCITVQDSGAGIPAAFLPHVFERFRQADASSTRAHGGLGLGLAIVRHLVELHGGTVQAESAGTGQGATFTVKLPLLHRDQRAADDPTPASAASGGSAARLTDLRLLLVEDDADTRELLAALLADEGAAVTVAASVAEALAALAHERPDVLLSDIAMPGEDGYTLIARVRALPGGDMPAIAVTAYAGAEHRQRALDAGYDLYLPKPLDPEELIDLVLAAVQARGTSSA